MESPTADQSEVSKTLPPDKPEGITCVELLVIGSIALMFLSIRFNLLVILFPLIAIPAILFLPIVLTLLYLGWVTFKKQFAKEKKDAETILNKKPEDWSDCLGKANVFFRFGYLDEALRYYSTAITVLWCEILQRHGRESVTDDKTNELIDDPSVLKLLTDVDKERLLLCYDLRKTCSSKMSNTQTTATDPSAPQQKRIIDMISSW